MAQSNIPDEDLLPPASLNFLISTLATQGMIALGEFPNPLNGKQESHPKQAKHFIGMLEMLEEKTKGNRTADEIRLLADALHQLRLAYVQRMNASATPDTERMPEAPPAGQTAAD